MQEGVHASVFVLFSLINYYVHWASHGMIARYDCIEECQCFFSSNSDTSILGVYSIST